jgi:microcystin-dependent protein
MGGIESVTLLSTQLPSHAHGFSGTLKASVDEDDSSPVGQLPSSGTASQYTASNAPNAGMGNSIQGVTQNAGGNQPHENRPPVLAIKYVIALQGAFPPRP